MYIGASALINKSLNTPRALIIRLVPLDGQLEISARREATLSGFSTSPHLPLLCSH